MRHRPAIAATLLTLALGAGTLVPSSALAATSTSATQASTGATQTGTATRATRPAAARPAATRPAATRPAAAKSPRYPFAASSPRRVDPWGAGFRQCTSYASWWLASHGISIAQSTRIHGPKGNAWLENASHWETAARQAGFQVSARPVVGAIAQWRSDERSSWSVHGGYSYVQAGSEGHVGVIQKVFPDGTALIADYNGAIPLGMHTFRGKAPRYLLIHT